LLEIHEEHEEHVEEPNNMNFISDQITSNSGH